MKKWVLQKPDAAVVDTLTRGFQNLNPLCAAVLAARGITTTTEVAALLNSEALSDPFLLRDMHEAVATINAALDEGSPICIYGDYDCDGITATVMLYEYLQTAGAEVQYYIPEREEGYGMNAESIRKLAADGISLIITVDNGISAIAEADLIAELGMTLVVTDHHQPGACLPQAAAVVDPHRTDCPSPFKKLCGAGVVLKLIAALDGGDCEAALEQCGELAAIATIADIVALTGENRYLVERGLLYLKNTERPGLLALLAESGLQGKPLNTHAVGFMLAPRINAAGRFGSPRQAAELLLCDDPDEAVGLARILNELNTERKETETRILEKILASCAQRPEQLYQRVLVLAGKGWHHGVIGIVAARLLERYGKPCIILTIEGDTARGSVRSFGTFSAYQCLEACSALLERFGGHPGAGGLTLKTADIPAFTAQVQQYAATNFPVMPVRTVEAMYLPPQNCNTQSVQSLELLAPFGEGNPQPLFLLQNAVVRAITATKTGAHSAIQLDYGGIRLDTHWFFLSPDRLPCKVGDCCHFLVTLEMNVFRGRQSVSVKIMDARRSGIKQNSYFSALAAYETYQRGEALPSAYYPHLCPTRAELTRAYRAIPSNPISVDQLYAALSDTELNYCKLRLCCDIFADCGLILQSRCEETVQRLSVTRKVDLEQSAVLLALRSKCEERNEQ